MKVDELKQALGLKPLPREGGFYAEVYRSELILPPGFSFSRSSHGPSRFESEVREQGCHSDAVHSEESAFAALAQKGERSLATSIYYLLTTESFSAMHRLASDEIWHFYLGHPVEMLQLTPSGQGKIIMLGTDVGSGMRPQVLTPRGTWQGAKLQKGGSFALLGATVFPGFDFADFELGKRADLLATYPDSHSQILELTR